MIDIDSVYMLLISDKSPEMLLEELFLCKLASIEEWVVTIPATATWPSQLKKRIGRREMISSDAISDSLQPSNMVRRSSCVVGSLAIMGGIRVTIIHARRTPLLIYVSRQSPANFMARGKLSTSDN